MSMEIFKRLFARSQGVNVYLALRLPKRNIPGENFPGVAMRDIGELAALPGVDLSHPVLSWQCRRIETEFMQSSGELMICDVILQFEEIVHLSEAIKPRARLAGILVPGPERMAKWLAEGMALYRDHNRWLDFPPGHIEAVYADFQETLKRLKAHFDNRETRIIEIQGS